MDASFVEEWIIAKHLNIFHGKRNDQRMRIFIIQLKIKLNFNRRKAINGNECGQ